MLPSVTILRLLHKITIEFVRRWFSLESSNISLINNEYKYYFESFKHAACIYVLSDQKLDLSVLTTGSMYMDITIENNRNSIKYFHIMIRFNP